MKITYPWEAPPENGSVREVADGVLWLRLPLPMALDHVNVYVLDDGDGWTLIDTGMKWGKVPAMWQSVLDGPLKGKPVTRVMSTHHHPDHIGFNGWFVERGAQLFSTRTAFILGRMLTLDDQDTYNAEQIAFYRRAGMREDLWEARKTDRPFNFADIVHPLPLGFTRLSPGQRLTMAGRDWTVRIGKGHAPAHATFWSDDGLVLSGDQVIPSISSNIGVYPTEPEANPLQDWLDTCRAFQDFAQDDQLILPGHKVPFRGLAPRLQQLIENHESALDRMRDALKSPLTCGEVLETIFKRTVKDGEYGLALVEGLAHCNYLWHREEVTRTLGDDGMYRWQMR